MHRAAAVATRPLGNGEAPASPLDQFVGDVTVGGRRSSGVVIGTDRQADKVGLAELGILGDLVAEQRHLESFGDFADLFFGHSPVDAGAPDAHSDDAVHLGSAVAVGARSDGVENGRELCNGSSLWNHRNEGA